MGRYRSSAQVMEKASSAVLHLLLWNIIHECRIWNSICAAELVFTSYPSDIVALTKRPLNISCAAVEKDHRTSASIIWFHNLKDPIPGLNVWVYRSHTGLLFFPSLREEDLGKYTCKAILGLSSINTTFNIYKAYIEPVFYSPSSQTVNTGESVSFHCVSGESRPLVEIKWTKDRRIVCEGFQFQGQYGGKNSLKVSGTLRIANVSKEDEGEYICATHNPLLNVTLHSTPATLKVKALMPKLLITKDPENITVAVGKTTTMHCTIQGSPRPNIMWYKNNKPLNDSREYKHDGNREVLMIRNVSLEDEGFYHCEGNNGNEVVTSQAAYLLPAAMGWKFIKQPCNVTARKGDSTTLQCRPPFSNPSARVSWFKNNYILNSWENPHLISKENGDLVFSSVEESDDGMYFCRASNPHIAHTVTSQRVSLKVLVLPNVTVRPKVNSVPLGSGATFHCQAEGRPTPSVVWYKGDQPIIAGRRIFLGFQNRTLHISSVVKSDEDLYICEATNLVGYSNQSTILSVTVAPVIVSFTNDLTVMNGSSAALTCTAIGDEIIVYSWYKNGHLIKTSEPKSWNKGQEILLLPRVNLTDEGTYRCVASSALGRDERTGKLRVHVPPSILFLNASIQVRHGLEFTLFCDASGIPKPSISWSFKNRPIIASNHQHFLTENGMLIIKKAMQSVEGIYECEVVNEEGSAKRSVNVSISAPGPDQLTDELSTSPSVSAPTISADRKHTDILHSDILTAIASNSGSVKPNGLHYSHSPSSRAIGPLSVTASSTASIGLQSPVPAVFVTLDIAVTSTVKQFSSPTISTVRPTSTSVLAAVRHFPSPQLSTMKPFPSPKMSTVKPFPSLPMSTVKPFPTPEMSTVKPFPSLVISTMKPFPTPEMSIRKLFPSLAMSTVKPFPSLVISTVKPFPSLAMSTAKPFPTPEMSTVKLFPSAAMSTVKPFPSLAMSTAKPFPSLVISTVKPFPSLPMSTMKPFPTPEMSIRKLFPSLAMSTVKPFPSLVISTVKPFPSLAMSTVKPFPSLAMSTMKPFPTPEMSTMKPFPTPEMSTVKPFPSLAMSTVELFPSLAMSRVKHIPIPTRSTRNAFPSLITPVALDSPSLDTPVPKKHFAPMDVALNLTRDFSKVNGTTQISNVISLLKIYLPANPGKKTIFTHEQLKVYTRNSTLPSLGSYLHYLSKTATKYSSEPTAWNSNYTTSQPFHSSVGTSGTIIREKAKARESSSYFALEKHDIPIVVGVTLSLTMIFITMCVYSVRQKKNENKEIERRLLRSSRMSSQNRGRFEMHTHDNRAFEEDSPSDAVEQTPHERQSVMASSPKQSSVKAIKVTAEFALVSQSESIISISGNNHLQTSHKDSSKVEQQDVKIPILSRSRSSLSHHEDRVKNPNTWKQSALFQEKPLTSVVMVELKRSSFTEEHQKVEMLTRSNSIPCYSKKASQREEQALFNASLHSDNKIQGASYFSLQTIERQPMNPGAVQLHSKLTPSDLSGNLSGTEKKCTEIRSIAADVRVYSQIPAAPSL